MVLPSPPSARLIPSNDETRQLLSAQGHGQALTLNERAMLGRSVRPDEGLRIPGEWIRFSSVHCKLEAALDPSIGWQWFCVDSSMNGTFINDEKLAKNKARTLVTGDKIRLSFPIPNSPREENPVLEFVFEAEPHERHEASGTREVAQEVGQGDPSPAASASKASKRRASTEPPEVGQLPHAAKRQASGATNPLSAAAMQSPEPRGAGGQPSKSPPTVASLPGATGGRTAGLSQPFASALLQPSGRQTPMRSPSVDIMHQAYVQPAPQAAQPGGAASGVPDAARPPGGMEDPVKQAQLIFQQKEELRAQLAKQKRAHEQEREDNKAALRQAQAQHKEEMAKLHERLSGAEAQLRQQGVQLAASGAAEAELAQTKARLEANHAELQGLRSEAWSLKAELSRTRAAEQMLGEQVAELTRAVAQEQAARAAAQEDCHAARAMLSAEHVSLEAARRSIEGLGQEQQALRAELSARTSECEALRRQLDEAARRTTMYEKKIDEAEGLQDQITMRTMMAQAALTVSSGIHQKLQEFVRSVQSMETAMSHFTNVDMPQLVTGAPLAAAAAGLATDAITATGGPADAAGDGQMDMRLGSPGRSAAVLLAATQIQQATQQLHTMVGPGHSPVAVRDGLAAPTQAGGTQGAGGYQLPHPRAPLGHVFATPVTPTRASLPVEAPHAAEHRQALGHGDPHQHGAGPEGLEAEEEHGMQVDQPAATHGQVGSETQQGQADQDHGAADKGAGAEPEEQALAIGSLHAHSVSHAGHAAPGLLAGPGSHRSQGVGMEVDQAAMQPSSLAQPTLIAGMSQQQQLLAAPSQAAVQQLAVLAGSQQAALQAIIQAASQPRAGSQHPSLQAAGLAPSQAAATSQRAAPPATSQPRALAGSQPSAPHLTVQEAQQQVVDDGQEVPGSMAITTGDAGPATLTTSMAAYLDDQGLAIQRPQPQQSPYHDTPASVQMTGATPGQAAPRSGRLSIAAALGCTVTPPRASLQGSAGALLATPQSHILAAAAVRVSAAGAPAGPVSGVAQEEGGEPSAAQPHQHVATPAGSLSSVDLPGSEEQHEQQDLHEASSGPVGYAPSFALAASAQPSNGGGGLLGLGREPDSLQLNDITNLHVVRGSSACDGSQLGAAQPIGSALKSGERVGSQLGAGGEQQAVGGISQGAQLPSGGDGASGGQTEQQAVNGGRQLLGSQQAGPAQAVSNRQQVGFQFAQAGRQPSSVVQATQALNMLPSSGRSLD